MRMPRTIQSPPMQANSAEAELFLGRYGMRAVSRILSHKAGCRAEHQCQRMMLPEQQNSKVHARWEFNRHGLHHKSIHKTWPTQKSTGFSLKPAKLSHSIPRPKPVTSRLGYQSPESTRNQTAPPFDPPPRGVSPTLSYDLPGA